MNNCCRKLNNDKDKKPKTKNPWKGYKNVGESVFTNKCNISYDQLLFKKKIPGFLETDISTRKGGCHLNHKNLSFSEILNLRKAVSYYDPKAFKKKNVK